MTRTSLISALWLACMLLAVGFTGRDPAGLVTHLRSNRPADKPDVPARVVRDVSGHVTPELGYRRVASGSSLGDALLLALAEPERIAALSAYGHDHSEAPHLYGARPLLAGMSHLERLLGSGVDLLLVNHIGSQAELTRAREAGLNVFNLGEMRGLATLLPNIDAVARLLGDEARGHVFAERLVGRMRAVASDIPLRARKRALYVTSHGGKLFGGGPGTSYHDVMIHAGLLDAAVGRYRDWPHYDPEQLLALDPELIVTSSGGGRSLCSVAGLEHLRACRASQLGIVELPSDLLGDPGPRMLEAAERLRALVYGPPAAPRSELDGGGT